GDGRGGHPHLGVKGVLSGNPVDGALDLAALRVTAARVGVVLHAHLDDVACGVALDAGALDDVGVAQADQGAGREAEVLGGRGVPEVVLLYIKDAADRDHSGTGGGRVEGGGGGLR